jgi:hypothetical protein
LWSELKEHLFDLFHGKCGYCEAYVKHVGSGDVEHYRPKAEVTGDKNHRGYYWLAYEPNNYLPACELCNRPAKKNNFPISQNSMRAYRPEDAIEKEEPLLLNPYFDRFSDHLKFVPSPQEENGGYTIGITERGKTTIQVLRLNRSEHVERRRLEQESVRSAIKQALFIENPSAIARLYCQIMNGERQYSTAALYEVNDYFEKNPYISLEFKEEECREE